MIIGHHCAQTGYWKLSFTLLRPDSGIRSQPEFLESNVMMLHVPDVLTGEQTQTFYKTLVESDKWEDGRSTVDRKSTRLNSSHVALSYAVSCSNKNIGQLGPAL